MSEVYGLAKQIEDAKQLIEFRTRLQRLSANPDFRAIVLDEFCVQECARYAQSSADPALSERQRQDALGLAQSAGHLKRWMSVQVQMANAAEDQIPNLEAELEVARAEEAGE